MDKEEIAKQIVDSALKVHKALGPGLLESAYQACLKYELEQRGLQVAIEVPQQVVYRGISIDVGYRMDMLVENAIIVENKCVEQLLPIHEAQIMTYLKLSECTLGFLINWNVKLNKDGIKRIVRNHPEPQWQLSHRNPKEA